MADQDGLCPPVPRIRLADQPTTDQPTPDQPGIQLRGPGGGYAPITATEIGEVTAPSGHTAFEAFAEVTSMVARYGAGTWTAAASPRDQGWTLVVVTADSPPRRVPR